LTGLILKTPSLLKKTFTLQPVEHPVQTVCASLRYQTLCLNLKSFEVRAPTGQISTTFTEYLLRSGLSSKVPISLRSPRLKIPSSFVLVTLINSSLESFEAKDNFFDYIYIHLPWGVLLKYVVTVDKDILKKLTKMLKKGGELEIVFGYDPKLEKSETKRLNLKELNLKELGFLNEKYSKIPGLVLEHFKLISNKDLKERQTSWSKKLAFGGLRNFFQINLIKK
jgi:hypothetical protein